MKTLKALTEITVVDAWNIRSHDLLEGRIQDYANHIEDMPPVRVAQFGGALYLIDGWHRMAAHRLLNRETIEVEIDETVKSESDAIIANLKYNLKHGAFFNNQQKRDAFKRAKAHRPDWS